MQIGNELLGIREEWKRGQGDKGDEGDQGEKGNWKREKRKRM